MKIVTKAAVEGMFSNLIDDISIAKDLKQIKIDLEFYQNLLQEISWEDPDYYYDRKAKLVKKVDSKYVSKNDLV